MVGDFGFTESWFDELKEHRATLLEAGEVCPKPDCEYCTLQEARAVLFLNCRGCGEAFSVDAVAEALIHQVEEEISTEEDFEGWDILPEDEAM